MFKTSKIEKAQFYLDKAFRISQNAAKAKKYNLNNKREKKKKNEIYKIGIFSRNLRNDLENIKEMFPDPNELENFYKELFEITINVEKLGKAFITFSWFNNKLIRLEQESLRNIHNAEHIDEIEKSKKIFYGRASSIMKKIQKHFTYLDEARRTLRNFPTIKTNMFTICICGFPNVGKSTLLSKLTTARPDIQAYAFTTKSLMVGYMDKIQLVDTPGTFKDILFKMNWIEKQSYLAIKYLGDYLIYVLDISESCGFNVKDQMELYKNLKKQFPKKKFLIYFSKNDIIDKNIIETFVKDNKFSKVFLESKDLKKYLKKIKKD
ncbi:MAG: 50S ribosome-binding GTPase [Nanoarchaeota archaeon]|nr:50S ribosome-binding GTPase [Nanoarchaeota archaeon]MBU4242362.1 50S ribosome-binding GTPase [Nanoarchaeota archaeon]MBU4352162.1 50S ribosome-binding GTPase [Nanoarchaeota archaeon]